MCVSVCIKAGRLLNVLQGLFVVKKSLDKIENIEKRALRFILNDHQSRYHWQLKFTNACLNDVFTIKKKCPHNFCDTPILERPKANTTKYGLKSFRNYEAKI